MILIVLLSSLSYPRTDDGYEAENAHPVLHVETKIDPGQLSLGFTTSEVPLGREYVIRP